MFSNIRKYAENNNLSFSDDECCFHNSQWHCIYRDTKLIFKTMSGQGTANWIVLANDEDKWNTEKCFKYEDYKIKLQGE